MNLIYIDEYLDTCKHQLKLSKHTLRSYNSDLRQYTASELAIKPYVEYLFKKYKKTSTIKRKIACLKSYYKYLETEKTISTNPFKDMNLRYGKEIVLPKTISKNTLKQLHEYFFKEYKKSNTTYKKEKSHRNLLIFELLLSTGIRVSELCHITLKNIDMSNKTILILGKGKKERTIYLGSSQTCSLLNNYIRNYRNKNDVYLFAGNDNKKCLSEQSVRLLLNTATKNLTQSGTINVTPHMFRHTFATTLLDEDVDIRNIQVILGHSSILITQIYTHVSNNKQKQILSNHNPRNVLL